MGLNLYEGLCCQEENSLVANTNLASAAVLFVTHRDPGLVDRGRGDYRVRSEGSLPSGASTRATNLYAAGHILDLSHDAVMRIGGEAPRRRAHSNPRRNGHVQSRVAATSDRYLWPGSSCRARLQKRSSLTCRHATARRARLSGISPTVARRQSAIKILRASATIRVLRVPRGASAVRARYHAAS